MDLQGQGRIDGFICPCAYQVQQIVACAFACQVIDGWVWHVHAKSEQLMQQSMVNINGIDGCMWICKTKGGSVHSSGHVHVKSNRLLHVHLHAKSSIDGFGMCMPSPSD